MEEKKLSVRFLEKALSLDRRYIFLLVAAAAIIPIFIPIKLDVKVTNEVRGVFDTLEKLPEGSIIFFSFDYEPAGTPECDPLARAVLRHIFNKKMKVVAVSFIPQGSGIGERILKQMAKEYNLEYGKDYASLGYRAGDSAMIVGLGQDLKGTFKNDAFGNPTSELPILKGINSLKSFPYLMCVHDDSQINYWIIYAGQRFGIKIGSACTAVMASGMYPFWDVGQITGIVGGLKGASEYEFLIQKPGFGTIGMKAQSVMHILLILMVIFGNIAFAMLKYNTRKQ